MTTPLHPTSPPSSGTVQKDIHLMLVDDSAVIRGALTRTLQSTPHIKIVKSLPDGEKAIAAAKDIHPHVIILDIEMPVLDGISALPKILEVSPDSKVIMFSSLTEKGASFTMKAMSLGAVECIVKPSSTVDTGEGSDFQTHLVSLINNLVPEHKRREPHGGTNSKGAKPLIIPARAHSTSPVISSTFELCNDPMAYKGPPAIVAIGSSTGGPQALFNVLSHCKGFNVPIVITQHMPATFTKILAQHITQKTGVETHEGEDGMLVEAGKAYVAPGSHHMTFFLDEGKLTIKLNDGPPVNFCKPAVDPMFESIVALYGRKVLGAILTGMGHDGIGGGRRLVAEHGRLIAQDEATSIVWGMPGAVASAGLCSHVIPLDGIGPWIKQAVMG